MTGDITRPNVTIDDSIALPHKQTCRDVIKCNSNFSTGGPRRWNGDGG